MGCGSGTAAMERHSGKLFKKNYIKLISIISCDKQLKNKLQLFVLKQGKLLGRGCCLLLLLLPPPSSSSSSSRPAFTATSFMCVVVVVVCGLKQ